MAHWLRNTALDVVDIVVGVDVVVGGWDDVGVGDHILDGCVVIVGNWSDVAVVVVVAVVMVKSQFRYFGH